MNTFQLIKEYLSLGFTHVIPLGFDHILFILSLFFMNSSMKSVVLQCAVFTFAHSLSLGVAAAGYIIPNSNVVEPLIALSILYAAVSNIIQHKLNSFRLLVVFLFGCIHGLGFASALQENGLSPLSFLTSLLAFNVGVELGQLLIIVLAYFAIARWFQNKVWYQARVVYPISSVIACIAFYWTIQRILTPS